ncbi:hypothetical protein FRC17_005075 [Serendipita sp. 399]|nr:hypothetical protein FRC17_005075 [Serendipita sp. 399]
MRIGTEIARIRARLGLRPPPKQRRYLFFLEPSFLLVAFILQLLVSLSLPIIKPIHLFTLHIKDDSVVANEGEIRFGLWGFCFLNEYDIELSDYGVCTAPQVGYTLNPAILATLGLSSSLYDIILQGLISVLLIHPIVATITLINLVPSILLFSKAARIVTLVLNVLSALLSTVVSALDIAIILVAKNQIIQAQERYGITESFGLEFRLLFGNAPWLGLAATVLLWAAVVAGSIVVCACMGRMRWDEDDGEECDVRGQGQGQVVGGGKGNNESGEEVEGGEQKEKKGWGYRVPSIPIPFYGRRQQEYEKAAVCDRAEETEVAGTAAAGEQRRWKDRMPSIPLYRKLQQEDGKG